MKCATCQHFSFQKAPRDIQKVKLGCCEFEPRYVYMTPLYERECAKHLEAAPDIVSKRMTFINRSNP